MIDQLQFVLNRKIVGFVADYQRIKKAVEEVYDFFCTEISNCPLEFQFQCPKKWLQLIPTRESSVRFCDSCSKEVYLCADENEVAAQAQAGRCIAIYQPEPIPDQFMMGLPMTLPIDHEYGPVMRAALRTAENPQTSLAAEDGEFYFLDTKVFDQSHMDFYDQFAANKERPRAARKEILQRRDALLPFVGKPILHGGLSHGGLLFDLFVDKNSGTLIHFEKRRELE